MIKIRYRVPILMATKIAKKIGPTSVCPKSCVILADSLKDPILSTNHRSSKPCNVLEKMVLW